MRFLIADTFTASLGKLTNEEQSLVKNTAFDLQLNPAHPGLQFHRIERARDKNFWSIRAGRDLRIIVHKTESEFLLCYVNHHNAAYDWAERRKLQTHPETGAAQLVEVRETIQEYVVPRYVESIREKPTRKPFANLSDSDLLSYGVPVEWIEETRNATDDLALELFARLPAEAGEALLELATGGRPPISIKSEQQSDPFEHPDAKRRFKLISSSGELSQALEYPWDKWTIFLHPEQRSFVEKRFNGPARVSGSAGTGKTIVSIHRAYNLASRDPDCRVLLSTFSDSLAHSLKGNLNKLIAGQPELAERIEVVALSALIKRLFEAQLGKVAFASEEKIKKIIQKEKSTTAACKFSTYFLWKEWEQIIDAWQVRDWEQYRSVPRLGRKTRLNEDSRQILWQLFERVRAELNKNGEITEAEACWKLEHLYRKNQKRPFDHAVIDEAQDISVPQLRLLGTLLADKPDGLFFSGDLGQRIFQQPFSWSALGVDIRGRSKTLKINYRTSQEIRQQADRLLDPQFTDVDGTSEDRKGTISVFSGPLPQVLRCDTVEEEIEAIARWIRNQIDAGMSLKEICVIVRSDSEISRAADAATKAGLNSINLDAKMNSSQNAITIATMHLAKGLEFRAVAVIACDDEIIPLQSRIEAVGDDADLQEVYATERQLLYVACTRARDCLLVTGVEPASEFLDDFEER